MTINNSPQHLMSLRVLFIFVPRITVNSTTDGGDTATTTGTTIHTEVTTTGLMLFYQLKFNMYLSR